MGGLKGTLAALGIFLLAACSPAPSKWNAVGVKDPLQIRMMDEWERRGLGSDEGLHEWSIDYSPNKRFAVIMRYYRNRFDQPPGFERSTYTYFRIDGDRPVFLRHEVWPELCYDALGNDGSAVILQFPAAAVRWIATDPSGQKQSGMLLSSDAWIEASNDGSFLLKAGLADYRIRTGPGVPWITRERFHEDPKFHDNGSLDACASIPVGLTKEEEAKFRAHLVELQKAKLPEGRSARFIRAYAEAALAIDPWPKEYSGPMPTVRQLLEEIAEPGPGKR